jgi:MFS family permease
VRLVSVLVFVDTMLYAALTPLLGRFAHELHLSSSTAGVLVAAYAVGALLGGLPGGAAAARMGPRRAVLTGLALMGAASLGFAWSSGFAALALTRLIQGVGSGFTWAGAFSWLMASAPRERRGELIGTAMGAAVFGALFGPVVGAAAALVGRGAVFSAVGALAVGLAVLTLRIPPHPAEGPSLVALRRALGNRHFLGGLGFLGLASLLSGVISVLAPLHLTAAGWGPSAIGAVWLVGAAIEGFQSPAIGRLSDRRGATVPIRYGLAGGVVVSLILAFRLAPLPYALLIVVSSAVYGILFTPAFALIADGAERVGLAQGMAFGMMNAAWAVGAIAGPAGAGVLAAASGDEFPFVLAALTCAGTLAAMVIRSRGRLAGTVAET